MSHVMNTLIKLVNLGYTHPFRDTRRRLTEKA